MPLLAVATSVFALAMSAHASLSAQKNAGWIGKRVVQKGARLTLTVNGEPVERGGEAIDFYRVEQADGPSLLLKAETLGSSGWAAEGDVLPADYALEFFSEQIRAHPADAFPYAARALLWRDKEALDKALIDYDEAIRLDPSSASHRRGRGLVWHAKKADDKAIADFDLAIRLDPKSPLGYIGRGASHASNMQYTKAVADFSEAIWLDPLAIAATATEGSHGTARRSIRRRSLTTMLRSGSILSTRSLIAIAVTPGALCADSTRPLPTMKRRSGSMKNAFALTEGEPGSGRRVPTQSCATAQRPSRRRREPAS